MLATQPRAALSVDRGTDYVDLKRLIVEAGLLKKRPLSYAFRIGGLLGLLGVSVALMAVSNLVYIQIVNAAFLAVIFGQLGFIAHDAGHRQILGRSSQNDLLCLLMTSMVGLSRSWWTDKHNRHHSFPNQVDEDPDIELPFISFTIEEAMERGPLGQLLVRFQRYTIVVLLAFQAYGMQVASLLFTAGLRNRRGVVESAALVVHHVVFLAILVVLLGPALAIAFFAVHHAVAGIYMGTVFAPNHKGMEVIERGAKVDFLTRQLFTSRNVKPGLVADFMYGGLNYQIEHHLFPSMPRMNLPAARRIIRDFCEERGLPYHETSAAGSYVEIFQQLNEVSRAVSASRAAAAAQRA